MKNQPKKLTRRQLLKLAGAAVAATAAAPALDVFATVAPSPQSISSSLPLTPEPMGENTWHRMGRAIHTVAVYEEPSAKSTRLGYYSRDESFPLLEKVVAPFSAHNDRWFRIEEGYVHSAWVLPIRKYPLQPFISDIGAWGFWGEVSQIYTEGYTQPSTAAGRKYRFYGGCVFYVIEALQDEQGQGWYKVFDDYPPRQNTNHQWVQAQDIRRIPRAEMAPIHPFAGNKHIVVDLDQQLLTCFEGDEIVFSTLVASGLGGYHATPTGEHAVLLKQASRHMSNVPYPDMPPPAPNPNDIFDLPGIPWNTFFDLEGRAIHGAYWHNDFGVRRSHGCLNVDMEDARWIYRWVYPIGGYEDEFIRSNRAVGTPITIV
ncbi:MAG: L,D-transpeptidase [Anaerolineae bacterium]|nr:L,D-transpeptidase [Anaerolineae bacterium]